MSKPPSGRFVGFFRLVEACQLDGCPICRCLAVDTRQYLDTLLYEHVTDPMTRGRLRASWGLCNWHAAMLVDLPNAAFGAAILGEDMLRVLTRRLERTALREGSRRARGWRRLLAILGRPLLPLIVRVHRRRAPCPACTALAESEVRYVEIALRSVRDPEFDPAYQSSQGLCVPHALRALDVGAGEPAAGELLARTIEKWAELRRDLSRFIAKHDYQNREPYTESEANSYARAMETLTGTPGLFPNDMGRERAPRRPPN